MLSIERKQQRGFTLIEVLIALLILAIGLLGMATLMMSSMQSTQGASIRSAATVAAYDLAERIRANSPQAAAYIGNPASATNPNCVKTDAGCSGTALVSSDLFNWNANLQRNIPGAEARLSPVNGTICIVIFWEETGRATTPLENPNVCNEAPGSRAFYTMQVTP